MEERSSLEYGSYLSVGLTYTSLSSTPYRLPIHANVNSIALAVREIFTGVRKFKARSHKPDHVPFDLVFA